MTSSNTEPLAQITIDDHHITLLGTAHVSKKSADMVRELLDTQEYDAVAVELCPSRYNALINPDQLAKMDLFQVLRSGKIPMVTASLALSAYQQRMAEQFGIEPGAEMRAAVEIAKRDHLAVLLIDREVGTTLKRVYKNVPWWQRLSLVAGLMASVVSNEKVEEEEIERLKEGDILETTFAQFSEQKQAFFLPLIDERDRYMAARLQQELQQQKHKRILVVIGAGHLKGIQKYLQQTDSSPAETIQTLDQLPKPKRWPKLIPWLIVLLVLSGFVIGFQRSPELGWQLVLEWVVINGGLSALGAFIAGAHPLTTLSAFCAAPLTSLNPTIGAGMVTATVEIFLRKPKVGDFSRLRHDTTHLTGWWHNRVSRTLLVFLLSTLGSAVGTYVAGFRILSHLS